MSFSLEKLTELLDPLELQALARIAEKAESLGGSLADLGLASQPKPEPTPTPAALAEEPRGSRSFPGLSLQDFVRHLNPRELEILEEVAMELDELEIPEDEQTPSANPLGNFPPRAGRRPEPRAPKKP